ncbi:tRNA (guanine(37)-N1)-methyltransferase [Schistocerca cancellata]|uniref:tRNA (guanine(37)-N1)-methyltransferase n=1 Tax=Schistocerca cancellata TaxID=274614 RepID=UPI0021198528|nr:tRNA (guanine(37)-N1)-methyltransferase [Schistocerca cancellata]
MRSIHLYQKCFWSVCFDTKVHPKQLKKFTSTSYTSHNKFKMVDSLQSDNSEARETALHPPATVRGLTKLDKVAFSKNVVVPCIEFNVTSVKLQELRKTLHKYLLRMENLKPLQVIGNTEAANDDAKSVMRRFLLNPTIITSFNDFSEEAKIQLLKQNITENSLCFTNIMLNFDNWKAEVLLKSVLPSDLEPLTSYSIIGHIIHVNIREHLYPFKIIIGEILLEKIKNAKTVVNKTDIIDNTYRNFKMEILCGENNLITQVRENHCTFELDFATVYWNPRLSTEHERIISKLKPSDVLYDVFAGIGPFAIPACKHKCFVLANDLNPEAHKWLVRNGQLNKVTEYLTTFNKDGTDFIINDVKKDMLERWKNGKCGGSTMHITMNLPALAVTFLKVFSGLFEQGDNVPPDTFIEPVVHVYCFCKGDTSDNAAISLVEENLGHKISQNLVEVYNIRNVAVNKDMMRVTFKLTKEILVNNQSRDLGQDGEPSMKRRRPDSDDGEGKT